MKQKHVVIVLFTLIVSSCIASIGSYKSASLTVNREMDRALAMTMREQKSNIISQDTIRTFNRHLQIAELRGKATITVDARSREFRAYARCSEATIFGLSDQKPALALCIATLLWALYAWHKRNVQPTETAENGFGGLRFDNAEGRFVTANGTQIQLTPMQQRLMEMFFNSPSHSLTKAEICDAFWPKKPDASETLYTLVRRLRPVVEQNSDIRIVSDRNKAYRLEVK